MDKRSLTYIRLAEDAVHEETKFADDEMRWTQGRAEGWG